MDAQQTEDSQPDSQEWDWESREQFLELNKAAIMAGITKLLEELTDMARYRALTPAERGKVRMPSMELLYKMYPVSFAGAFKIGGRIFTQFWLSRLEVKPYTTSTTLITTELVMKAPDGTMSFVDITLGTGWSTPLRIDSRVRPNARL